MKQLQTKKQNMVVYFIVSLLIGSSIIYLQMGLRDALRMSNHSGPSFRHQGQIHGNSQNSGQIRIPGGQMAFFIIAGLAHIPVAIWILKNKRRSNNKVPYIIAIAGSAGLIILYVLSRTLNLPLVGFEEHVGSVDLLSKILQVGIIIGSTILLLSQGKQEMTKLHIQA